MWLAVDHGNTRIKWTRIRGPRHDGIRSTDKGNLSPLAAAAREATAVWISHVGSEAEKKRLQQALKPRPHFLQAKKRCGGVTNHYRPPASLGTDRWLCLLAARPRRKAVIIISAGTALTIDGLSADGHFIGGVILPGLQLMSSSLATATALPPAATAPQTTPSPPLTTAEALGHGRLLAAIGAITQFRRRHLPAAAILITGGDGETLSSALPTASHIPDLLFQGMIRLKSLSR